MQEKFPAALWRHQKSLRSSAGRGPPSGEQTASKAGTWPTSAPASIHLCFIYICYMLFAFKVRLIKAVCQETIAPTALVFFREVNGAGGKERTG